jgi:predicted NUDIX family NTP pyrophosphohydrolase
MSKKSAGIFLFRRLNSELQFLLVHPGGPFWIKRDLRSWSIPKGEFGDDEDPLAAAKREFREETGQFVAGDFIPLDPVKQRSGKLVYSWGAEGEIDTSTIKSNNFELEWPPKSGKKQSFPEIDKGEWFKFNDAKEKIVQGQLPALQQLFDILTHDKI